MCLRRVGDLLARERATERWLQEQVGPAYDALKAEPSRTVSADKVRSRIAAEHKALSGTKK
jgi:antitoxin ParD1/3/4